ncbi:MAG TPA: STAS domain-containing protein [Candidatus Angelobacter sp.]
MKGKAFSSRGLKLDLEETPEETVVRCRGKITVRSAQMFQSEICGRVIPASRGKGVATTCRIVLDLSQVTYVDSTGLGALFAVWKAGQSRSCEVEIINLGRRAEMLASVTRLDHAFSRIRGLFSSAERSA